MSFKSTVSQEWRGKEVKIRGKKVVNKTAFEVGLVVEGQAKLLCPVNWGYLAASITTQAKLKGTEPTPPQPSWGAMRAPKGDPYIGPMKIKAPDDEMEVLVGTPVFYGPYMEFGTVRTEAQAFLRPSFVLAMGGALTILEKNGRLQFKEFLYQKGEADKYYG